MVGHSGVSFSLNLDAVTGLQVIERFLCTVSSHNHNIHKYNILAIT